MLLFVAFGFGSSR